MINTITIQGRLTRDPELRTTQSGSSVCSFTLANDNGFGEYKKTLFIDCVAWKGAGETIAKYCTKGQQLVVSGVLNAREWNDKDGNKRKAYEITVSDFGFCGDKGATANTAPRASAPKATDFPIVDADFSVLDEGDGELPF
jgi:single-strand DNA-binding protein